MEEARQKKERIRCYVLPGWATCACTRQHFYLLNFISSESRVEIVHLHIVRARFIDSHVKSPMTKYKKI